MNVTRIETDSIDSFPKTHHESIQIMDLTRLSLKKSLFAVMQEWVEMDAAWLCSIALGIFRLYAYTNDIRMQW